MAHSDHILKVHTMDSALVASADGRNPRIHRFWDRAGGPFMLVVVGSNIALHLGITLVLGLGVLALAGRIFKECFETLVVETAVSRGPMTADTTVTFPWTKETWLLSVFLLEFIVCLYGVYLSIKLLESLVHAKRLQRSSIAKVWLLHMAALLILSSMDVPVVTGIEALYQSVWIKCLLGFSIFSVFSHVIDLATVEIDVNVGSSKDVQVV